MLETAYLRYKHCHFFSQSYTVIHQNYLFGDSFLCFHSSEKKAPESKILFFDWWDFVQAVTVHNFSHCPICWPSERLKVAQPWDIRSSVFFLTLFIRIEPSTLMIVKSRMYFLARKLRKLVSLGYLMGPIKQMLSDFALV